MSLDRIELSPHCIVCESKSWSPLYTELERCDNCTFVRARASLAWGSPSEIYEEDYFTGEEYGDYLGDEEILAKNFERRWGQVLEEAQSEPKRVLEVGCAYGFFLKLLADRDIHGQGIDICEAPVSYAREHLGLQVRCGDFLEADFAAEIYDLICLWDTLEHLAHPDLYLEKCFRLTNPGGWVALTTGDIGSSYASARGARWRMIHPPTHLHYFSAQTVTDLLERLGFEDVRVEKASIYRDLRSVLQNLESLNSGIIGRLAGLVSRLLPLWLQRWVAGWVDFGDIMLVCARRPQEVESRG